MQNAFWTCAGGIALLSCPSCTFINSSYYTAGDTVINSITYIKIKKGEDPQINDVNSYPTYTGAIRQDTLNKKIYIVLTDSTTEKILYDFSQQVGDTINSVLHDLASSCVGFTTETIVAIDSIPINGNYHKRFQLQGGCYGTQLYYIEGIGSTFGLLFPNLMDMRESYLQCVNINNKTYYPDSTTNCQLVTSMIEHTIENSLNIFPNPASNEITVKVEVNLSELKIELLDIAGRKVKEISEIKSNDIKISLAGLGKGIYFVRLMDKWGREYSAEKIIIQ
jgi:hypothetical protein